MKDIRYSPLISLRIFVLLLQLWFLLYPIMVWLRFLSYIILIFLLQELEVARLEICPLLIMQEGFQSKDLEVPLLKLNVIAISNFWENIWHIVLTTKNGVCRRHPFVLVSKFCNNFYNAIYYFIHIYIIIISLVYKDLKKITSFWGNCLYLKILA